MLFKLSSVEASFPHCTYGSKAPRSALWIDIMFYLMLLWYRDLLDMYVGIRSVSCYIRCGYAIVICTYGSKAPRSALWIDIMFYLICLYVTCMLACCGWSGYRDHALC